MSLKTRGILVLVIGTILGLSLSLGGRHLADRKRLASDELSADQARLLTEVMERVRSDYVEPVDPGELVDSAIRGMVADLDRHSEFLDADEYRDIRNSTSGSYFGIGLEVSTDDGAILVIAPIDGTPAQRAGIESGDEIVEIDGVSVRNDGLDSAIRKMRGHPGTSVVLSVQRQDYDDPLTFEIRYKRIEAAQAASRGYKRGERVDPYTVRFQLDTITDYY